MPNLKEFFYRVATNPAFENSPNYPLKSRKDFENAQGYQDYLEHQWALDHEKAHGGYAGWSDILLDTLMDRHDYKQLYDSNKREINQLDAYTTLQNTLKENLEKATDRAPRIGVATPKAVQEYIDMLKGGPLQLDVLNGLADREAAQKFLDLAFFKLLFLHKNIFQSKDCLYISSFRMF